MGWRFTPIGLNLNRDYLKVETPEMRALIGNVYTKWWPHLLVDNHTTDGADYRHDLSYAIQSGPGVAAALDRWLTQAFEGRVVPRTKAMGHLTAPYFDFVQGNDPRAAWRRTTIPRATRPATRRSTAGRACWSRPTCSSPTPTRVQATYDLMVALLEEIAARPRALTGAVAAAEAEAIARGRASDPAKREVVLTTRVGERRDSLEFKGWATRWEPSEITGTAGAPLHGRALGFGDPLLPRGRRLTVRQPVGYVIPRESSQSS